MGGVPMGGPPMGGVPMGMGGPPGGIPGFAPTAAMPVAAPMAMPVPVPVPQPVPVPVAQPVEVVQGGVHMGAPVHHGITSTVHDPNPTGVINHGIQRHDRVVHDAEIR